MTMSTEVTRTDLAAYYDQVVWGAIRHSEIAFRGLSTCTYSGSHTELHGPCIFLGDCACTVCKDLDLLDPVRRLAVAVPTATMEYLFLLHVRVDSLNLRAQARAARAAHAVTHA